MIILGIETSCDETGVALYSEAAGLMAQRIYSQIALHEEFGGVVPELASRDQIQKLLPLILQLLRDEDIALSDLTGIAFTAGPGLAGALMVGACVGRSLAWALGIPAIAVNHLEAHLLAPMLEENPPTFPHLALLVSGGHCALIHVEKLGDYKIIGETQDDAVGEAFDKTARILDMPYPGGPKISALATQGDPTRYTFPRPMTDRPGLDFSFSGIKTFAANLIRAEGKNPATYPDIAASFQRAIIDTLVIKSRRALKQTGLTTLVVSGGVSANQLLREELALMANDLNIRLHFPRLEFCTDNGAMVAYAGYQHLKQGEKVGLAINIEPRWRIESS
jgi:N6-L-threonylcarbamoyladenine synthase